MPLNRSHIAEPKKGNLTTRALRLAVLRIGLVSILAGIISYAINHHQIEQSVREELRISTQERLQREAMPFLEIQHRNDNAMREFLELCQNKARKAEYLRDFDLFFCHRDDGAWVSRDALYDGVPLEDGRVFRHVTTAINPGVPITEELKIRMAVSVPLVESYGDNGNGRHIDFGIIFPEGGLTLYWPGQRYSTGLVLSGPDAFRMQDQDWFKIGFTAAGPGHARTRMYLDTPSGNWLVSNVSRCAIQPDGTQPASTISDLSLANLMERAAKPGFLGTDTVVFLADRDGTLIFHPEHREDIKKTDGHASIVSTGDTELLPVLKEISTSSTNQGTPYITTTSSRIIAFGIIPGTDWVMAIRYPKTLMRPAILNNLGIVAAVGLVTLLVEIFLLRSILQNQVAQPLSQLIRAALRLGDPSAGFDTGLLPKESRDEIGDLSEAFRSMADQLRESFTKTRASEEKLRTLLDVSPLPIAWMNSQGVTEFWNRKALELFGYAREEIDTAEKWFTRAYPDPEYRRQTIERWNAACASNEHGHIQRGEYEVTCKDGRVLIVEIIGTRCGDLTLAIFNDVTGRKLAEEELRQHRDNLEELVASRTAELRVARDQAEAANRAKSTFLANMTHEIRTPMNAILGYAQLMCRDRSLTPEQRERIKTINHAGEHLLALINDVLEMSKIEAGRITRNDSAFDLHGLLEDLIVIYSACAKAKGITLTLEKSSSLPRHIVSDEGKIRQTLMNLLGNAVKFTTEGGVTVMAEASEHTGGAFKLTVTVTDTGPGLSTEEISKLFRPFVQSAAGARIGGTGLGLAISRQYARLLDGDIIVLSEPGSGASFVFTAIAAGAQEADIVNHAEAPSIRRLAEGQSARVLVADDVAMNCNLIEAILEPMGFLVKTAADGAEAVAAFHTWKPDAILMDIRMPIMDGYESIRRIRASPEGHSVLIVGLTASAFEEDKSAVLASGADFFMRKPFRLEDLLALLGKKLDLSYQDADEPSETARSGTNPLPTLEHLPSDVRSAFVSACSETDYDRLIELCDELAKTEPGTASAFRALVFAFDYEQLSRVITESPSNALVS